MTSLNRVAYLGLGLRFGEDWQGGGRGKSQASWTIVSPCVLAVWFGAVTGLLELGLLYARSHVLGWSSLSSLQMSRHFGWMIPLTNLVLFVGWGITVGFVTRVWPSFGIRHGVLLLSFPTFLALLLLIPGLYAIAYVALAAACATVTARGIAVSAQAFWRLVWNSLPVLVVASTALCGWNGARSLMGQRWASLTSPAASPGAMNVVLMVMDTVRADHLSLHGYHRATTPNLERLAARGVRFDQARATAPWTLPSHASMFTGLWPHQTEVGEDRPLDDGPPTLAAFLATRGYLTAGFVANTYFCNSWYGLSRGFAHYEDFYDEDLVVSVTETLRTSSLGRCLLRLVHLPLSTGRQRKDAEEISNDFLDWLGDQEPGRPFFAFLNFFDAHSPYILPEGVKARFCRARSTAEFELLQDWENRPKRDIAERDRILVSDAYDDCIAYLDAQIGKLVDDLERRGLLKNTLVIITSDHGEELGEHQLYGHGKSLYAPELRVPLLILVPGGAAAGQTISEPVSLRDLPATVVDLLKASADSPFPGSSLVQHWHPRPGAQPPFATGVLSEVTLREKISRNPNRPPAWRGPMAAIAAMGSTYIRNADGREELYDLDGDPEERHDLAGSASSSKTMPGLRDTLRSLMAE